MLTLPASEKAQTLKLRMSQRGSRLIKDLDVKKNYRKEKKRSSIIKHRDGTFI